MTLAAIQLDDDLLVERFMSNDHSAPDHPYPRMPFFTFWLDFHQFLEDQVPWHKHREFEWICVKKGRLAVKTGKSSLILSPGDLCMINAYTLHQLAPEQPDEDTVIQSWFAVPEFISGTVGSAIDSKYVSPVMKRHEIDLVAFLKNNSSNMSICQDLDAAENIVNQEEFGYELDLRNCLSRIWKHVILAVRPQLNQRRTISDRNEERMQTMLTFIQKNYRQPIDLQAIADSAMISERECFRCFRSTLGVTPINYLQNYRIRMAARRLVETDDTVIEISESVGFNDNSYFGRVFRKYMHCTPSDFRRRHSDLLT